MWSKPTAAILPNPFERALVVTTVQRTVQQSLGGTSDQPAAGSAAPIEGSRTPPESSAHCSTMPRLVACSSTAIGCTTSTLAQTRPPHASYVFVQTCKFVLGWSLSLYRSLASAMPLNRFLYRAGWGDGAAGELSEYTRAHHPPR